jgi:hypothetical protein
MTQTSRQGLESIYQDASSPEVEPVEWMKVRHAGTYCPRMPVQMTVKIRAVGGGLGSGEARNVLFEE